jgi:hypothetical protein
MNTCLYWLYRCQCKKHWVIFVADYVLPSIECVVLMKHIKIHIFVLITRIKPSTAQINHPVQLLVYYTHFAAVRIRKESMVQSQHRRRHQKGLYAVRPCSSIEPIISEVRGLPSQPPGNESDTKPNHRISTTQRVGWERRRKKNVKKTRQIGICHCYKSRKKNSTVNKTPMSASVSRRVGCKESPQSTETDHPPTSLRL